MESICIRLKQWQRWERSSGGFTLLEAIVAAGLTSLATAVIFVSVLTVRDGYVNDVHRTRINSNLRSAMDILSMHIRQAGEYLPALFPAVEVLDGGTSSDELVLRRGLISEVLTLCEDAVAGSTVLVLSSGDLTDSACYVNNVAPTFHTFVEHLNGSESGVLRLLIFNRIALTYEMIEVQEANVFGNEYRFTIDTLQATYPRISTTIYLVEEMQFSRSVEQESLTVRANHISEEARALAFHVDLFNVSLIMSDESTATEFELSSTETWKEIKKIAIQLTGSDAFKGQEFSSSISGEFFPRNVLSYD